MWKNLFLLVAVSEMLTGQQDQRRDPALLTVAPPEVKQTVAALKGAWSGSRERDSVESFDLHSIVLVH
jgi:hypothetical protein